VEIRSLLAKEADCGLEAIKRQQESGGLYYYIPATSQMDSYNLGILFKDRFLCDSDKI
jgi:hypothetical protein